MLNFLGEEKSQEFISLLPKEGFGKLIFNLFKTLLISLCLIILLGFVVYFADQIFNLGLDEDYMGGIMVIGLVPFLAILVPRYFYSHSFASLKRQLSSIGFLTALKHAFVIEVVIGIAAYIAFSINYLFNRNELVQTLDVINQLLSESQSSQIPFIAEFIFALLLWLSVGIAEELLFRAIGYRMLRRKLSRFSSIVVSSFIFMVLHPLHLISSLVIFLGAVIFSFYFEYKNNLLTPILAHMLQDFMIAGVVTIGSAYTAKHLLGI